MKRFLTLAASALMLFACNKAPKAVVQGSVADLKDTTVTLQRFIAGRVTTIDTIKVDSEGCFKQKIELTGGSPAFYYLCDSEKNLATLVLLPGDKVKVAVADGDYTIEGSQESLLLKEVADKYAQAERALSKAAVEAYMEKDPARRQQLRTDMGRTYVEYRKYAIQHAFSHPQSITSAAIVFQKFSDELPVFGEVTDGVIFKQIYDSIQPVYPTSEYVTALKEVMESRTRLLELSNKIYATPVVNFPEIKMPDINGQEQSLTALEGKVIILSFWSAAQNDQKMFNRNLMELYAKYASRGLEIYQVALDVDKATWATTVKSQNLPWISVNDGLGSSSPAVRDYNITTVPTMFVFDRKGTPIARDAFDIASLTRIVEKAL